MTVGGGAEGGEGEGEGEGEEAGGDGGWMEVDIVKEDMESSELGDEEARESFTVV